MLNPSYPRAFVAFVEYLCTFVISCCEGKLLAKTILLLLLDQKLVVSRCKFIANVLGRIRLGSIRKKNNWNNASKRLFGSYSHSGIPGFPFRLFWSQEQNSRNKFRNIFRNIFLFRNVPNERTLIKAESRGRQCSFRVSPRFALLGKS